MNNSIIKFTSRIGKIYPPVENSCFRS